MESFVVPVSGLLLGFTSTQWKMKVRAVYLIEGDIITETLYVEIHIQSRDLMVALQILDITVQM